MSFDSLKVYAHNHNTPIFYDLASALPFVVAKFFMSGLPTTFGGLVTVTGKISGLFLVGMMALLQQRRIFEKITSTKSADQEAAYRRNITSLAAVKIIYMACWLVFLFSPLKAEILYQHLAGYSFILCAIALYTSISAPFPPLFYLDVGVQLVFACALFYLNRDMPEIVYVAPLVGMFALYTLLIGRKITRTTNQLLKVQKDLENSARVADRANRAKSEFLAMMSHEIRTPMAGVLGMVDFLRETPLLDEQKGSLDTISECSKTLLNTLNDVLDISRMEAGKLSINRVNFDFHGVLMNSFKILKPYAEQKNISLEVKIEGNVPTSAFGDPSRLQQVIINLVNNAIKFTHKGGVTLTARFAADMFRVEVKDTGIGISEKNIKRLFQKFSQADGSISRKYGGSGLGLSISKQLVELMGGRIGVASAKDQGSLFWFEIPYLRPVPEKISGADTQALMELPPQRILLVEDNQINQAIATRTLTKKGHSVAVAVEGEIALQMLKTADFDVILMDCSLPGKSGIEITREIKKLERKYSSIPIIALTANAMEENLRKCREAGMVDHVTKPFSSSQLYSALARHLKGRKNAQAASEKTVAVPATPPSAAVSAADGGPTEPISLINAKLKVIHEEFGPEYVTSIVAKSSAEIRRLFKEMNVGIDSLDYEGIYKNAHDMKGIAGYIGMERTREASEKIEKAAALKGGAPFADMARQLGDVIRDETGAMEAVCRRTAS